MTQQLQVLVTSLDIDLVAKELPDVLAVTGYTDDPIECFIEQPKGFGSMVFDLLSSGMIVNPHYPRLSMILVELRTLLISYGISIEQLKSLNVSEEPKTIILTLE